jgi:cell division protein FtsI (penicillin-binding protein 3)
VNAKQSPHSELGDAAVAATRTDHAEIGHAQTMQLPDTPACGAARVLWVGRVMIVAVSLGLLAILFRVGQLQTHPAEPIAKLIDSQRSGGTLLARRGALLDRRGRSLATTRVAQRLFVDPALIVDYGNFSEKVSYHLGYEGLWIDKMLSEHARSRYVVLDPRLSDQRVAKLSEIDVPGLASEPVLVRDYPHGNLAGHLIGFVGVDGHGLEGLERTWEATLLAQTGGYQTLRDARRRTLWVDMNSYQPNRDGQSVRLSLDVTIQAIVEAQLAAAVTKFGAKAGQMVVMDPNTGEILALANYPSFDPAKFRDVPPELRRNRVVTDMFEPGSIFKPFVWSALTQLGIMRPDDMVDCTTSGVWLTSYGRRLRDASAKGMLSWVDVQTYSSNIGMAKGASKTSIKQLHDIVRAFGFGQSTDSGLPGEVAGLVNPLDQWNKYSQSSIPMGQEIGVTAMQIVRAFCAFANDGWLVQPTIEAITSDHRRSEMNQQRILSSNVANLTRSVLRKVVTDGTGKRANSKQYALFGKTGTAQLPDFENGGYHQNRYVSSFIAGAPYRRPRLVVGCFIRQPDKSKGHYGGLVAGPAVMRVIEQTLAYLHVAPNDPEDADLHLVANH